MFCDGNRNYHAISGLSKNLFLRNQRLQSTNVDIKNNSHVL